ncbi:hypothetical protein TI39_contig669g00008 [Zymoseptoria brevis]|uniref:Uncharacterized protein n=1 Tax=Zymoseptoria brevis TaxID=1047168 RepID=A0A0F4GJI8_9PEZI|nr:hypothetical protein TI39_contig669g00008 [Zymoseptoria brevis]
MSQESNVMPIEATSSQELHFAQSSLGYHVKIPDSTLKGKFCYRRPLADTSRSAERMAMLDTLRSASQASLADMNDDDKVLKTELERQLQAARAAKEAAVCQATKHAEMKAKVQLNMRDLYKAKIDTIKKAVLETPDKSIKEVWEVADKARPPPAIPKPGQLTSAPPAVINGLAFNAPYKSDQQPSTADRRGIKTITNPILQRLNVNVFVTTPRECDGIAHLGTRDDEKRYLTAAQNLEAFPTFPGASVKSRVTGWPLDSPD